jgi:Glyoxalase-like domain
VVLARASEDDRVQDGCGVINVVEGERVPSLRQVVLDCTDARSLAEFYRRLLGLIYRPGDEPPGTEGVDERGGDWLVLRTPDGDPIAQRRDWTSVADEIVSKVNTWLNRTGYPLEMRVDQKMRLAQLQNHWERESNLIYKDLLTGEERESDYYLDWWEENDNFALVQRVVIECKSTTNPWVVFQRHGDSNRLGTSIFDYRHNLTYCYEQRADQLYQFLDSLSKHLDGRIHQWPAPGYAIVEAFKGPNGKDAAHNAVRQALSAGAGIMADIWDGWPAKPGCSTIAPVVVTTSPLFEARLEREGTSVAAQPTSATSVLVRIKSIPLPVRVLVINENKLDDLIADCRALETYLPEFARIFSPQLVERTETPFYQRPKIS